MANTRKRKRIEEETVNLTLEDVMCPVCRSIVIEPVSLPCRRHVLCYFCFEKTIENNTLTCPICRKRIGSWLRSATKSSSLINLKLWSEVQKQFPEQIKRKQNGEDDGVEEDVIGVPDVSKDITTPGEIKKEFEEQLQKYSNELTIEKQRAERASVEYIHTLLESEIQSNEERKKALQKIIETDESVARGLQINIYNELPVPNSNEAQVDVKKVTELEKSSNKQYKVKDSNITLHRYFGKARRSSSSTSHSSRTTTSSRNSIDAEFSHFKPINREPKTPPKRLPDGSVVDSKPRKVQPLNLEMSGRFDLPVSSPQGPTIELSSSGYKAFSPIRQSAVVTDQAIPGSSGLIVPPSRDDLGVNASDSDTDFENETDKKNSTVFSIFDPSASSSDKNPSALTCDASIKLYSVLEKEIKLRSRQEEADRKFAEYLQNMWDEKDKSINLRSEYELRSRPSRTSTSSVRRQTTLDKHVQPVIL